MVALLEQMANALFHRQSLEDHLVAHYTQHVIRYSMDLTYNASAPTLFALQMDRTALI